MAAIKWANAQNGNWSVATNWSPMVVPTSTDDVTIDASGTYTVEIPSYGIFVHTFNLNDISATLAFDAGASFIVQNDATFSSGTIIGNQCSLVLEGATQ